MSYVFVVTNWRRVFAIIVTPIGLMLWSRLGAPTLLSGTYQNYTQYEGVYRTSGSPGVSSEPIAEQVVIFVVDGLRVDESRKLPGLNELRALGAQRVLLVGEPSLSYPGWTTITTGAWPEQSGISSNDIERALEVDTIFASARRRDMYSAIVGVGGWRTLFNLEDVDLIILDEPEYNSLQDVINLDEHVSDVARDVLLRGPELVLIHLLGVDNAGHGFGGSSDEYTKVAGAADRLIRDMVAVIDLKRTAVLVTADHGHIDSGGHGGYEKVVRSVPFVAVGKGTKPGVYGDRMLADIAPTVAVLLGIEIPAHNQGDALLDQIDAPAAFYASSSIRVAEQLSDRYRTMLLSIDAAPTEAARIMLDRAQTALAGGDYAKALELAGASVHKVRTEWREHRHMRLNQERVARIPAFCLILVLLALYASYCRRAGWGLHIPLLGAVMFFVSWHAVFWLQGFSFSASLFNTDPQVFVRPRVVEAIVILMFVMMVPGALRSRYGTSDVALTAVHTLFLVGAGLLVQIAGFYLAWDVVYRWYLPDITAGVKVYLDLAVSTVFWPYPALPMGVLLPLLAVGAARITERVRVLIDARYNTV